MATEHTGSLKTGIYGRERWHAMWLMTQGWTAVQVAKALERDAHTIGEWMENLTAVSQGQVRVLVEQQQLPELSAPSGIYSETPQETPDQSRP